MEKGGKSGDSVVRTSARKGASPVLAAINRVFQEALKCDSDVEVARTCLAVAEELTGSQFGFIGEINAEGRMDTIAISNPGWDACRIPESDAVVLLKDMELRGVWARVLLDGQKVMTNDPPSHPDWIGPPAGHPPLASFLGVPLKRADAIAGMIAVANRDEGYREDDMEALSSLSTAFVEALFSKRAELELVGHRERLETLVTERTEELARAYLDVKHGEERFRRMAENARDIVWRTDMEGNVQYVNPAVEKMLGLPVEEAEGVLIDRYMAPESIEKTREWIRDALREGKTGFQGEVEYLHHDGSIVDGEYNVSIVKDDTGRAIGLEGVSRDITDRKRAQRALKESQESYSLLFETMPNGWAHHRMVYDDQGRPVDYVFLEVNRAFERFTGLKAADIRDKGVREVIPGIEEAEPNLIEVYGKVASTGVETSFELFFEPFDKWYSVSASSPRKGYFVAVFDDITTRKKAEEKLQSTLDELARSNQELEMFAYVASHDLQEPLRMISSYLQLLEKRYKNRLDPDADEFIHFAVDGAARLQRLINDLLSYSRLSTHGNPFEPVDCNTLLEEVLAGLEVAIEEKKGLVTHGPLPTVNADRTQLARVIQNLLSNAIKFSGDGPPEVHLSAETGHGEWVFSVRDNGIGMEPRFHDRIFSVFQRLHGREYPGTGIGLAVCRKVVERHGGRIWVESEPGKGTTFSFSMPELPQEKS